MLTSLPPVLRSDQVSQALAAITGAVPARASGGGAPGSRASTPRKLLGLLLVALVAFVVLQAGSGGDVMEWIEP